MISNLSNTQILLKEYIKQERKEINPNIKSEIFFQNFSITQLLKNYDLNNEEIENNITDGGLDGGCDGIYIFVNEELLNEDLFEHSEDPKVANLVLKIFQVKETNGFSEDALMKWKSIVQNLLDMSIDLNKFQDRYSEPVLSHFTLFRDAVAKYVRCKLKTSIQFYYITYALSETVHPNVKQQAKELEQIVKKLFPSTTVEVNFIGADILMELINNHADNSPVNLQLSEAPITLGHTNEFVALVNLSKYFKFITDEHGILKHNYFEGNVRDYQGHNYVNRSIADTLNQKNMNNGDFWWLNNGVTILAEQITHVSSVELQIMNPEIVNGLQTSTEIYNYFSENKNALDSDNRNLLVRLVVPSDESTRDSIIFATNNQTNISKSNLRVTDDIHLQIELYFKNRGLFYERRKNYYKNQKKSPKDIVSVSFLAQCMITIFLQQPYQARARPSTLLTDDGIYSELYEKNKDLEVFYLAAIFGKRIQDYLKQVDDISSSEKNDILFYLLYGVVVTTIGKRKIYFNDIKSLNADSFTDAFIDEIYQKVLEQYTKLGGNGRVAKSSTFINQVDDALFVIPVEEVNNAK